MPNELYLSTVASSSAEYEIQIEPRASDGLFKSPINVKSFTPETIQALKQALGYSDVIIKCSACGQWGAIKTACKHCGSPIG